MDFKAFTDKVTSIFSSKFEEAKDAAVLAIAEVQAAAEEEVAAAVEAAKTPAKPAFTGKVQATVRADGVVHFQAGKLGSYTKGDITDAELAAAVGQQLAYGTDVGTSFYGSATRYVPVELLGEGLGRLSSGFELDLPGELGL